MSFFDLDPLASQNKLDRAIRNPLDPNDLAPAWYSGAWKGPFTGLAATFNDAALMVGDAATSALRPLAKISDDYFKTNLNSWLDKEQQKAVDNIEKWAPDPRTSGTLAMALHGIFNIGSEAVLGGPETAAGLQGYKGFRKGMNEGLNMQTALGTGAIDAVTTWIGAKLPMSLGAEAGLAKNVGMGVAGSVPVGMASRAATGEWLKANGYDEMAQQYKAFDQSAIIVDLLMGGAFGSLGHFGPKGVEKYQEWREKKARQIMPSDIDTALTMNNALHKNLDTAPGIPTDPASAQAHVEAMNKAFADFAADRPVDVSGILDDANFLENPTAAAAREQIGLAVLDHLGFKTPKEFATFQAELEARGLPLDDIDQSGIIRINRPPPQAEKPAEVAKAEKPMQQEFDKFASEYQQGEAKQQIGAKPETEKSLREIATKYGIDPETVIANADAAHAFFSLHEGKTGEAAYTGELAPIINEHPTMQIPVGDGEAIPAVKALQDSEAEISTSKQLEPGFEAAANCALRG